MSEDSPEHRLDPDRAASEALRRARQPTEPVIDTRPYRRMIGAIGIGIAIVISALLFITKGVGTIGVPPGQRVHWFVAPLATSTLNGDVNLNPHCDPVHPNRRALNLCRWFSRRVPVVLGLFVPASSDCVRQIDAMQTVSRQFSGRRVQFAAVAVRTSHTSALKLVHSHRWTFPVAYDRDGAVGEIYGVQVCPMVELVARGGVVKFRLTGDGWLSPPALAAKVRELVGVRRG
ncbi:MAG TPA: TlpA disulfide reductase family protein [Solirubrobacteraceae bacterium]|nr:TlpA disulfide reductase family protein [Solirubrobacteraceae bacterium]